jgi:hypothetical protein
MKRFIEGANHGQSTMLPELLDDYVDQDNQVRVVDIFVDQLTLPVLDSSACSRRQRAGLPIIRAFCLSSTFTATSIELSRAGAWSAKLSGTSN